ncbi:MULTISPECIES: hypothetical protein [Paracoccaceae]|jgi:hypothetical protein|uniref:EF-hand domain-containing protein n=1 Tax=Rhodophyticola porphyridii TaxID=1852017 RepID=A0A3L9Y415_9RHOB|nr:MULTISPECIES: hypothetical protein [Paracoccaceae]MBO6604863.1 hypothetical protein [Roseicyclus sp.]MBO6624949.1 hypothetical protein [Roseicyclus sp.]MBO6921223.1 hypothetical protein [Roseicyclus sp.]RMA42195.1 hypothetical protein D9R08_11080 [Rhodophyticola porphyridii]
MTFPQIKQATGRRTFALWLGALALVMGLVAASYAMGQGSSLDTDGDGLVSYTELLMAMPDMTETDFATLDADESGALDADELNAAQEAGIIPAG